MRGRRVQLREDTHENSLIPLRNSGSSSTLYVRIFSCGTPCRSKTCITAREKPHCGNSGVPFIKRTSGETSMAFWICARASEVRSRRKANDVAAGDPRVKGASWGNHEHIKAWTLLCRILSPTESLEIDLNMDAVRTVGNCARRGWWTICTRRLRHRLRSPAELRPRFRFLASCLITFPS